jgi:hypothetical protein
VDGADQVANAQECSAADSFPRDFGEPPLNLVEPGGTGRREVHLITGSRRQPLLYLGMFVRSIVVEDQMNRQVSID